MASNNDPGAASPVPTPKPMSPRSRPDTGKSRPDTGKSRPDTNKSRPGTGKSRPGTGKSTPGVRPGTVSTEAASDPTEQTVGFTDVSEIQFAEFEMRVRKFNLELVQPTIRKMNQLEHVVMEIKGDVKGRKETLHDLEKTSTKVEQQVLMVETFREEMGRWDMERRHAQAESSESLAGMRQDLDTFRYQLERQDSALDGVHRTLDRVVAELGRAQDGADSLRGHVEARLGQCSRLLNSAKTDIEVKLTALESRFNRLSDDLWGEETGLTKVTRDLAKTNMILESVKQDVDRMRHDKANVLQLTTVQEEVSNMLNEANSNTTMLKHTVDSMLNDVKAHFRTATNTVAAHNAEMLREVRGSYQDELAQSARLRNEIMVFMEEADKKMNNLETQMKESQDSTQGLVQKVWTDVDEVGRQRKRDRNNNEVETKSLQERLAKVHYTSDTVARWVEHLSGVMWMLVQGERAASALEVQDDADRGKVALMGYRETKGPSALGGHGKAGGGEQGSARKRAASAKGHMDGSSGPGPVINVDQRCLSCSGQAQTVLSGFKMACLQYTPGPVTFAKKKYNRGELLDLRVKLLDQAHESLQDGPIKFNRSDYFGRENREAMLPTVDSNNFSDLSKLEDGMESRSFGDMDSNPGAGTAPGTPAASPPPGSSPTQGTKMPPLNSARRPAR